eukprot:6518266-Alexandrium_andersonii.AAC.1
MGACSVRGPTLQLCARRIFALIPFPWATPPVTNCRFDSINFDRLPAVSVNCTMRASPCVTARCVWVNAQHQYGRPS